MCANVSTSNSESEPPRRLTPALVALLRGVVYQEGDPALWQSLVTQTSGVRDYLAVIGLELILDEAEGYAYARQRAAGADVEAEANEEPPPRLVARRPLSYPVSLLVALLRRKLAEFDATSGETRLILSRDEIVDLLRIFLPPAANEARVIDKIDGHIQKVVDLGFLRALKGTDSRGDQFEVRRILKAFVDAQWLQELERRLGAYRDHAAALAADAEKSK